MPRWKHILFVGISLLLMTHMQIACTGCGETTPCEKDQDCPQGQRCQVDGNQRRCQTNSTEPTEPQPEQPTEPQPEQDGGETNSCPGERCAPDNNPPERPEGCPSTCQQDTACAPCGADFACVNRTCQDITTQGQKTGDPCDPGRGEMACATGYSCLQRSGQRGGVCVRQCNQDPSVCTQEGPRAFCAPWGGQQAFCVLRAKEGDTCSRGMPYTACVSEQPDPPLACGDTRRCVVSLQDQEDGPCNPTDEGITRFCDGRKGLVCDPVQQRCKKAEVTSEVGAACDPTGEVAGKRIVCDSQAGLLCIPFEIGREIDLGTGKLISFKVIGRCHRQCEPEDTTCGPNTQCTNPLIGPPGNRGLKGILGSATFVCMTTQCQSDADCPLPGDRCRPKPFTPGQTLCLPGAPSTTNAIGQPCQNTDANACPEDWLCITKPDSNNGFCSKKCNNPADCPAYQQNNQDIPSQCTQAGPQDSLCLFPCDPNQPQCPQGLTCQTQQGVSFCAVP